MSTIPVFSQKQLAIARRTNMLAYMQERGETFEKISSKFLEHTLHDSMRANAKTGVVNWYSQGISSYDNAIDFVMTYYQEPYEQVVCQLLDFQFNQQKRYTLTKTANKQQEPRQEAFRLDKLSITGNYDTGVLDEKGWDYLRSRYLSDETIQEFVDKQMISSDNRHNILFKFSDIGKGKMGTVVGADVQGTYARPLAKRIKKTKENDLNLERKYFKGIALNSHGQRGFLFAKNVDFKEPITLYVTESPIESLSLYELDKEYLPKNSFFLSLSGLKEETLWRTCRDLSNTMNCSIGRIVLAVNNDEAGKELVSNVHGTYSKNAEMKENTTLTLYLPTAIEKGDYNEVLEMQKTGRLASRELKEKEQQQAQQLYNQQKAVQYQEVSV
ncbi:DUF3991 domain-containing protein [Enterococcus faecalis]|uniref:DUF3991 domain-containing protein n=1 Tax=Enterococcus faecalis TaxID=1351 RepID=UPI001F569932|nr:DUF3991 domain-containing protein [Enterococcus faecalis]